MTSALTLDGGGKWLGTLGLLVRSRCMGFSSGGQGGGLSGGCLGIGGFSACGCCRAWRRYCQGGFMATLRSLAISLLRLEGRKNIAAANRHHARDPQRTLILL
jgi:hypothetical protein